MMRSVHGPVRPVCEHGSSVQYSVAPRAAAPASSSAWTSACGSPARSCAPWPTHDAFVRDDAGADDRVRRRASETAARVLERPPHPPCVVYHFS